MTPRSPPPPWTSSCPDKRDPDQTSTGTDTRQERTAPRMTGPGRTTTDRPKQLFDDCASKILLSTLSFE
jgi:hypothetical protein